jgi:hypothetical protein
MAAVPKFYEVNGTAPGTPTEIAALVFCSGDYAAPGYEHPMLKPTGADNRSYVKTLGFGFSTGPSVSCSDFKLYSDGTIGWTGCLWQIGDEMPTVYVQATGVEGSSGTEMTALYTGVVTAKRLFSTYTSAAPKTLTGIKTSGTGIYTRYFAMQVDISSSATVGALGSEAITASWLEV